jgi:hypothetical protein
VKLPVIHTIIKRGKAPGDPLAVTVGECTTPGSARAILALLASDLANGNIANDGTVFYGEPMTTDTEVDAASASAALASGIAVDVDMLVHRLKTHAMSGGMGL